MSSNYAENMDELTMLCAHCQKNGITMDAKSISQYLMKLVDDIIKQSRFHIVSVKEL